MAITFTDTELRTASSELVNLPAKIANLGGQGTQVADLKTDAFNKDQANKLFYDEQKGVLASYYAEFQPLNGTIKTLYSDTDLLDAAKSQPGTHYPVTPTPWVNLTPKLAASNNGNPTTSTVSNESATLSSVTNAINDLRLGFNDGVLTDTAPDGYAPASGFINVFTGGFVAGQRIVVDQSNQSFIATITLVGPPIGPSLGVEGLNITLLSGDLAVPGTPRVRNWHPGFTNNEREGVTTPYAPQVRDYFGGFISTSVANWKVYLQAQLAALNSNNAKAPDLAEITQAKIDVQAPLTSIATYQAAPAFGAGVGKMGDTVLNPLYSGVSTRAAQIPTRAGQITTRLGSVSQAPDGSFSGTGQLYTFFKWVDARCDKSGGTLSAYYGFDLTGKAVTKMVDLATDKQSEYGAVLLATKLSADANGTNVINVASAAGFVATNPIYIHDDNTGLPTVATTIVSVLGNAITVGVVVSAFTTNKTARIVKYL